MFWGWYIAIGFIIFTNFILATSAFTNRKRLSIDGVHLSRPRCLWEGWAGPFQEVPPPKGDKNKSRHQHIRHPQIKL